MNDLQFNCSQRQAALFVAFLLLYEISTYISNDMIMPGILQVIRYFHAPDHLASSSLTAFILGGATLQIFLGPLSDRFGRRPVMISGAVFFLICTLLISVSHSMETFIWGRFFQGMGLCFISVIGYSTLHELYNEISAVRLISIMSMITVLAPLAGPLLGATILHSFSWRIIFVVIAISSGIALIGLWRFMPETVNATKKDGSHMPFTALSSDVIKTNYLALIKNKIFMLGACCMGTASVPLIAWIGLSPLILMKTAHLSVFHYALLQIPIFICTTCGNLLMRYLTFRTSLPVLTMIGSSIMISGLITTGLFACLINITYIGIIIGICGYGFGLGLTGGPLSRLTLFSTPIPKGTASALMSLLTMSLTGLGNETAGYIYRDNQNLYFSLFCAASGIIYLSFYYFFYVYYHKAKPKIADISSQALSDN